MLILNILTILAIVSGPVIAVQVTRYLEHKKEQQGRRLEVYRTLMTTRAVSLSVAHVEALNRIDLEFVGDVAGDKPVVEAWRAYLDHLSQKDMPPDLWNDKRVELLASLLKAMGQSVGYSFDLTHIKRSIYTPGLWGEIDSFWKEFRSAIRGMMASPPQRGLPIFPFVSPTTGPGGATEGQSTGSLP